MSLCMAEKTRVKKENSMDNAGIFFFSDKLSYAGG